MPDFKYILATTQRFAQAGVAVFLLSAGGLQAMDSPWPFKTPSPGPRLTPEISYSQLFAAELVALHEQQLLAIQALGASGTEEAVQARAAVEEERLTLAYFPSVEGLGSLPFAGISAAAALPELRLKLAALIAEIPVEASLLATYSSEKGQDAMVLLRRAQETILLGLQSLQLEAAEATDLEDLDPRDHSDSEHSDGSDLGDLLGRL